MMRIIKRWFLLRALRKEFKQQSKCLAGLPKSVEEIHTVKIAFTQEMVEEVENNLKIVETNESAYVKFLAHSSHDEAISDILRKNRKAAREISSYLKELIEIMKEKVDKSNN